MGILRKVLGQKNKCVDKDAGRDKDEERRKDDLRRRLRLLQAEVDVMRRNHFE